jgi:signal transduction histidine kinase
MVHNDKRRLTQILINLICNALKFTEQGYIKVKTSRNSDDVNILNIEVEDTGIGISEEN